MVSIDFFTVPTIRFQVLYVFLVLAHDCRRILHFNVTAHPTAEWTGQQLRKAFPFEQVPRYLLRDRDAIFGEKFQRQVTDMGIHEVLSTPRSPWQRAYVERVIGSIRRECLDHVIVFHFPWERTRRYRDPFSHRKWGESWRCPNSAGCITVTNDGLPEKPDHLLPPFHQSNLVPKYAHVQQPPTCSLEDRNTCQQPWGGIRRGNQSFLGKAAFSLGTVRCG